MTKRIIRTLQKADVKKVQQLMLKDPDVYPKEYVRSRKPGSIFRLLYSIISVSDNYVGQSYKLVLENEIIGHIAYWQDQRRFLMPTYELRGLVIDSDYRGNGYGRELIKHVENKLLSINARDVWLVTGRDEHKYYIRQGYEIVSIWYKYWGDSHGYFMIKNL